MAAGAEMIKKHMKGVGILAGSGHLDNPITNSIVKSNQPNIEAPSLRVR